MITEAIHTFRQRGGWMPLEDWTLIELQGKDVATYLQSQTTQDVVTLEPGQGNQNALVDRKARVKALFSVHRLPDRYLILVDQSQSEALYHHLEQFYFIEEVTITPQPDWQVVWLEGPDSEALVQQLFIGQQAAYLAPGHIAAHTFHRQPLYRVGVSLGGEEGQLLVLPEAEMPHLLSKIETLAAQRQWVRLNPEAAEILRIETGLPRFGLDYDSDTQLPETGLETQTVNYNKGCYLGQEVLARIKTYGVIPRALIGLIFDGKEVPPPGTSIQPEGKVLGEVRSGTWSPTLQRGIAFAYLHKNWRKPGQILKFEASGQTWSVEIQRFPFYQGLQGPERALELYEQALNLFAGDDEAAALPLLQAAIARQPDFSDAYESLGVILSRLGQHEEAIQIMLRLTEVAPENAMAHTNLSRFYMLLGDKETAEQHMAQATRLNMLKEQKAANARQLEAQQKAAKLQMMDMFKEVLETEDPDDLVANFGLGKGYCDLEQYAEALPYLRKAVMVDKFYSVAWLHLGKALEKTEQLNEAREAYQKGRSAASQKGDLMPLKEIEQRLAVLAANP